MIGNDVVDIAKAKRDSNWERPGYLEKVFTKKEQCYISTSENKTEMVWRLWSMKEAAYKLYTQLHHSRFYAPNQFCCDIDNTFGKVCYKDFSCVVKTHIQPEYIVSEARLTSEDFISTVIKIDEFSDNTIIQNKLIKEVASAYSLSKNAIKIRKDGHNIPTIHYKNDEIFISLSHHGNFGAYAFTK